jgi:hypothetical protein
MKNDMPKAGMGQVSGRNSAVISGMCYGYVKGLLKDLKEG